mgnify:CR=1 FL=1
MNLWYITVLVITTLSPPEGYMQYTQGFKDEASCQSFLNEPGVKEQVEAGKELPFDLFGVYIANKTKITNK